VLLPLADKDGEYESSKGNALSKFGWFFLVEKYFYFMLEIVSTVYIAIRFSNFPFSSFWTFVLEKYENRLNNFNLRTVHFLRYIMHTLLKICCTILYLSLLHVSTGHAVAHLVEALCYKPEGRGFDSRWSHWNFSVT
jgi:hypothetical protein